MIRLSAAALIALTLLPARPACAQTPAPAQTPPVQAPAGQPGVVGTPTTTPPLTKTVLTIPTAKSPTGGETFNVEPVLTVTLDTGPAAAPAFDEHGAYVALKNGTLVGIDLDSGAVRWTEDVVTTMPLAVSGGLVVVAGNDLLSAFDGVTGALRWQVPVAGGFSAPPLADTGWVVAVAADGGVYTVRASDGMVLWTHALGARAAQRPVIAGDAVYFALADARVVSLSLLTGDPRWDRVQPAVAGPLLVLDDRLFFGADDKWFYCLNPKNGKRRWRRRTGGRPVGPAAVDEKHVYYTSYDDILWAVNRGNGNMKWRVLLPRRPAGGPVVLGDVVVVAGVAFEVYGYRARNGVVVGKASFSADVAFPPEIMPAASPQLSGLVVVTRDGMFEMLRRRVEPAPITMPFPLGEEIPLTSIVPPAPSPVVVPTGAAPAPDQPPATPPSPDPGTPPPAPQR
jgi:outer membrane protein assembly factor BamB